jgi:hypothetical protein
MPEYRLPATDLAENGHRGKCREEQGTSVSRFHPLSVT